MQCIHPRWEHHIHSFILFKLVRSFLTHKYELRFDESKVLISEKDFRTKRRSWYKHKGASSKVKEKSKDSSKTRTQTKPAQWYQRMISYLVPLIWNTACINSSLITSMNVLKRRQMSSPWLQIQEGKNGLYNTFLIFLRTSTNSTRNILFLYKEFSFSWNVKSK